MRQSLCQSAGLGNVQVGLEEDGLRFTWEAGRFTPMNAYWNDQVMLLAYFPDVPAGSGKYMRAYFELSGATRSQGFDLLRLPAELLTYRMEVFISVVSNDRRSVAKSEYVGRLN